MVTVAEPISPRHRQHRTAGNSFAQRNRRLSDDWFIGHCSPAIERSAGTDYAWNILYQGDLFNAVAATYNTPNGVFNPGQDSMLAPNPGMQMAGLSAYSQPQGFWGFYAQHEQGIQTGVAVTAGLAASLASFGILAPEAGAGIAAVIAAQAASGAAGGFTTGYLESGFNGGSFTQNLEAGTINGGIGAVFGGGLSAAGIFAPYAGQALASGFGSLYGGLTDAATLAGQYAGSFWEGFSGVQIRFSLGSGLGGELFQRLNGGLQALGDQGFAFPSWKLGDAIDKITVEGEYPEWSTIRARYWQNRAAAALPGEFGPQNIGLMGRGFAPAARILAEDSETGEISEMLVSKELHHALGNRGVPGFDTPLDLREVWPWEHAAIDPNRNLGYIFTGFSGADE